MLAGITVTDMICIMIQLEDIQLLHLFCHIAHPVPACGVVVIARCDSLVFQIGTTNASNDNAHYGTGTTS